MDLDKILGTQLISQVVRFHEISPQNDVESSSRAKGKRLTHTRLRPFNVNCETSVVISFLNISCQSTYKIMVGKEVYMTPQ